MSKSDSVSANTFSELIQEGDMARERGQFEEAKGLYRKALAAPGSESEKATALIHLGIAELATKDATQALSDFEQAQAADGAESATAEMWMAVAQQYLKNTEAAAALYRSSIAAQDPHSTAAATTMELYAQLLQDENKNGEANAIRTQATEISLLHAAQTALHARVLSPDVYQVGGDVSAPQVLSKVEPQYTQEARIAKYQGKALLFVEIGADGSIRDIKVIRTLGFGLDEKAVEAVSQWRFKPATRNEQPVAVSAQIEVDFRLL